MIFPLINRVTATVHNESTTMNAIEVCKHKTFELAPEFDKNIRFTVDLSLPTETQLQEMREVAKSLPVNFYDISNFNNCVLENIVELYDNMNNINDVHVLKRLIHKISMQTNLCNEISDKVKVEAVGNFVAYDSIVRAFPKTLKNTKINSHKTITQTLTETNAFDESTKNLLKYLSILQKHIDLAHFEVKYFISLIKQFEGHQILFDGIMSNVKAEEC